MKNNRILPALLTSCLLASAALAQTQTAPVTNEMLVKPDAADWLR